jgi:4'-phosphopantetheinyl transferase
MRLRESLPLGWSKDPFENLSIPSLGLGEVHLVTFTPDPDLDKDLENRYGEGLSQDEKARAENLRHPETRSVFIQSRGRLRSLLGHHLGIDPKDVPLVIGPHGKPGCLDASLQFNLAHTKGTIVIALAVGCDVGVDVEGGRPLRQREALIREVFSPKEQSFFEGLDEAMMQERFFRGWTLKEAYVKATGRGIAAGLSRVVLEENFERFLKVPSGDPDAFQIAEIHRGEQNVALVYRAALRQVLSFHAQW